MSPCLRWGYVLLRLIILKLSIELVELELAMSLEILVFISAEFYIIWLEIISISSLSGAHEPNAHEFLKAMNATDSGAFVPT